MGNQQKRSGNDDGRFFRGSRDKDIFMKLYSLIYGQFFKIAIGIFLALAVGSIFILILDANPLQAYRYLILGPFMSNHGIGDVIAKTIPILTIGVGVAIAFKAGLINLGGEGQFYMGALGIVIANHFFGGVNPYLVLPLGLIFGVFLGAFWGGIAGIFKGYLGANEIITTLMLNFVSIQLIGYFVHGPLKQPGGLMPQTHLIPIQARLPRFLTGTQAHYGLFFALACVLIYYLILNRTKLGYNIRVIGGSLRAAQYSGLNVKRYRFFVMALSGAFAGLAGVMEVAGIHYRLLEEISPAYGFTGLVVALLGMLHPLGLIVAALFMATIVSGADIMQIITGVPVTIVYVMQGLVILFVLWSRGITKLPRLKQL